MSPGGVGFRSALLLSFQAQGAALEKVLILLLKRWGSPVFEDVRCAAAAKASACLCRPAGGFNGYVFKLFANWAAWRHAMRARV